MVLPAPAREFLMGGMESKDDFKKEDIAAFESEKALTHISINQRPSA